MKKTWTKADVRRLIKLLDKRQRIIKKIRENLNHDAAEDTWLILDLEDMLRKADA